MLNPNSKYFTRINRDEFRTGCDFKLDKAFLMTNKEIQDLKKQLESDYKQQLEKDKSIDFQLSWIESSYNYLYKDTNDWESFPFERFYYFFNTKETLKDSGLTWRYRESGIGKLMTIKIEFSFKLPSLNTFSRPVLSGPKATVIRNPHRGSEWQPGFTKKKFTLFAVRDEDDWFWTKSTCYIKESNSGGQNSFADEEEVNHYYKADSWLGFKKLVSHITSEYKNIIEEPKNWIGWH